MMKKVLFLLLLVGSICGCHRPLRVLESSGEILMVDSTLDAIQDSAYLGYITPIKADLERELNVVIGYAPNRLPVHQPECSMLNWASDALFYMAQDRCPNKVDMVAVNIDGMRTDWAAGDITRRHIFELMPFDNELVVLTMRGDEILNLCDAFIRWGGQGVAGLRLKARNGKLISATIDGKEIVPSAYYTVATSDYLSQGNDGMVPLKNHLSVWRSEEKIRDLYIEYVERTKTVSAEVDGRMDIQ